MTVEHLIQYLSNPHCPKDAKVVVCDEDYEGTWQPQVVWWSDDRETVYIGKV